MFGDNLVEIRTKRHTVYRAGVHARTDDPPRELIPNDENPVCLQMMDSQRNSSTLQRLCFACPMNAPHDDPSAPGRGQVGLRKNPPNHVFVDFEAKGSRQLLCDSQAARAWAPSFHLEDSLDELLRWAFGIGLAAVLR